MEKSQVVLLLVRNRERPRVEVAIPVIKAWCFDWKYRCLNIMMICVEINSVALFYVLSGGHRVDER